MYHEKAKPEKNMISLNLRKERISLIQMWINHARGEGSEQFMDVANLQSLHDP